MRIHLPIVDKLICVIENLLLHLSTYEYGARSFHYTHAIKIKIKALTTDTCMCCGLSAVEENCVYDIFTPFILPFDICLKWVRSII